MGIFSFFATRRSRRPSTVPLDRIAVYGRIEQRDLLLSRVDLEKLSEEEHTPDVGAFARGESGRAVRLRAIIDLARPRPGTLYANFEARTGTARLSHFLTEVQDLGWIAYAPSESGQFSGFLLLLPGMPAGYGRLEDLARIEFADQPSARRAWADPDLLRRSNLDAGPVESRIP